MGVVECACPRSSREEQDLLDARCILPLYHLSPHPLLHSSLAHPPLRPPPKRARLVPLGEMEGFGALAHLAPTAAEVAEDLRLLAELPAWEDQPTFRVVCSSYLEPPFESFELRLGSLDLPITRVKRLVASKLGCGLLYVPATLELRVPVPEHQVESLGVELPLHDTDPATGGEQTLASAAPWLRGGPLLVRRRPEYQHLQARVPLPPVLPRGERPPGWGGAAAGPGPVQPQEGEGVEEGGVDRPGAQAEDPEAVLRRLGERFDSTLCADPSQAAMVRVPAAEDRKNVGGGALSA